ncbi:hypothetical protein D3C75_863070 [compost metagenome]
MALSVAGGRGKPGSLKHLPQNLFADGRLFEGPGGSPGLDRFPYMHVLCSSDRAYLVSSLAEDGNRRMGEYSSKRFFQAPPGRSELYGGKREMEVRVTVTEAGGNSEGSSGRYLGIRES